MAVRVLERCPETIFVLAHLGGNELWDDVESILAGNFGNLYMDTSLTGSYLGEEQLLRIIQKHGADKILLASDCPWDKTDVTIAKIKGLALSDAEKQAIFVGNAKKLLHLP